MGVPLKNTKSRNDFFSENISKSHGKHNVPGDLWEKVSKIRNRPIQLIKSVIMGDKRASHTVIPSGYKGYIIDYPEAFVLSDHEIAMLAMAQGNCVPAMLLQHTGLVFLQSDEFKRIPPFFDSSLACFVASEVGYASA